MLHMEIIQQRLERESNLSLVQTAPNVTYEILTKRGDLLKIANPTRIPDPGEIEEFREPMARVNFILPAGEHRRDHAALLRPSRDVHQDRIHHAHARDPRLRAAAGRDDLRPLRQAEVAPPAATGRWITRSSATTTATSCGWTCWSTATRWTRSRSWSTATTPTAGARRLVKKLKGEIDRHQFEVAIQAAIGSKIIARESISALRKNVTAKCYGGDVSRKRKLLEKQKEGKKRMKQIGNVEISQEAFLSVLDDSDG